MAVYTKHGQRIRSEAARIDASCYFGDQVFKIRAVAEGRKKEQVYWVRELLADNGRAEVEGFVNNLKRQD